MQQVPLDFRDGAAVRHRGLVATVGLCKLNFRRGRWVGRSIATAGAGAVFVLAFGAGARARTENVYHL